MRNGTPAIPSRPGPAARSLVKASSKNWPDSPMCRCLLIVSTLRSGMERTLMSYMA
jgi:hypothetical protein